MFTTLDGKFIYLVLFSVALSLPQNLEPLPPCADQNMCHSKSQHRRCFCDDQCGFYGDCCFDRPLPTTYNRLMRCISTEKGGIMVVNRCSLFVSTSQIIKDKCQNPGMGDDILNLAPMTSLRSGISYSSYFCALCNGERKNLLLWSMMGSVNKTFKKQHFKVFKFIQKLEFQDRHLGLWMDIVARGRLFNSIELVPLVPQFVSSRNCNPTLIDSCPSEWTDGLIARMCHYYLGPLRFNQRTFKNFYCALCNKEKMGAGRFSCFSEDISNLYQDKKEAEDEYHRFILEGIEFTPQTCTDIWDPLWRQCRSLLPATVAKNNSPFHPFKTTSRKKRQLSILFGKPQTSRMLSNCTKIPLDQKEYMLFSNNSLLFINNNVTIDESLYFFDGNEAYTCLNFLDVSYSDTLTGFLRDCRKKVYRIDQVRLLPDAALFIIPENVTEEDYIRFNRKIYVCDQERPPLGSGRNDTDFQPYNEIYLLVDDIVTAVSIVGLLLHLIFFAIIPDMRNLPGMNLASLGVSLIFFYVLDIWKYNLTYSPYDDADECVILGSLTPYFLMVSILWMNAIAFDICRTFRLATSFLRSSVDKGKWKRFFVYSLYSWAIPLCPLTITLIFEMHPSIPQDWKPTFELPYCESRNEYLEEFLFYGPVFFLLVMNALFFGYSACIISKNVMKIRGEEDAVSQSVNFALYLRLALVMGLSWLVVAFADFTDKVYATYSAEIVNKFQGLLIFLLYTCFHPKVKKLVRSKSSFRSTKSTGLSEVTVKLRLKPSGSKDEETGI